MTEQMDRKDLKARALLEKVASLTAGYEEQIADLRVELTIASAQLQELGSQLAELKGDEDGND